MMCFANAPGWQLFGIGYAHLPGWSKWGKQTSSVPCSMSPFFQAVLLTKPTRSILSAPFQPLFVVLEDYFE